MFRLFRILLTLLIFISPGAQASQPEYFYISLSGNQDAPQPSITADRSDTRVKWFDDTPRAKSPYEIEFGAYLPKDFLLALRYKEVEGTHLGEASRYQCFFKFCSWISGSIVAGLPANDQISYRIRSGELWLEKAPLEAFSQLRLRLGVNVIHAQLKFAGAGVERTEQGILPVPFIGFSFKQDLFANLSFVADGNYSKFEIKKAGVTFRDASVALSAKLRGNINLSAGVKKYSLDTWYHQDNITTTWTIPQTTPFIKLTLSY